MARAKIEEYDIEKLNEKGLTISEINKLFVSSFPDSFGFKVYRPKKGTKVFDLQPDYDTDGYYGINDENLRLSFDKFHSLNYKVHQGDENTSFYFVLDGNDNQSYIGTFGFKDRGDVPKEYVTEFIAFLHKIYNFPFKVSHEVYKDGGGVDYYDFDKKMALINLNQIHEYSIKLDNLVSEDTQHEEWVKMKLTRIEQNVADVKKSIQGWEKFEGFGDGGRIFKKQLLHIAKYANDLIEMIKSGSKLMSWQENKLAISAEYIDGIYHHLDYKMGNRASDIEYANGGGINSGRDKLFKSQEPHEQAYKRKREWKEYKKEGWFGDWFKDGGKTTNYKSLLKKFNSEKESISIYMIASDVAEDFMRQKFDKTIKWEELTDEEKTEYNKNYRINKENFENYLVKEFLNKYYSEEKFKNKFAGQSRKTIDAISKQMYIVAKSYSENKYANGGGIKTDFSELENTKLRNVLISFWNDFFNNHIANYLSIEKENYILSNIDNVFVIVRNEDKGNFSDVEKQKIDVFLSPYFDSSKKPLFSEFFVRHEIKDNKIIIHIKERNMYSKGGGVGNEQKIKFNYAGKNHDFSFTPEEPDWWTSFESNGLVFDVHYDEDYNEIVVYEFIDGETQTEKSIYSKKIMANGGGVDFMAEGGAIKQNEGKLFNEKGEMLVYKKQSETSSIYDVDVYEPRKTDVEEYSKFKYCKREKNGRECVYRLDKKALLEMIKKEKFIYAKGGGVDNTEYAKGGKIEKLKIRINDLYVKRSKWIGSSEAKANQKSPYDAEIDKLYGELKKEIENETETYNFFSLSDYSGKSTEEKAAKMFYSFSEKNPYASLSKFIKSLKTPAQKEAFRKLQFPTYQKKWRIKMIANKTKDSIKFKKIFSDGGEVGSKSFSDDTNSWFDDVADKSKELENDSRVLKAIEICNKEATRDNLEKLRDVIKTIPYSISIRKKIDNQIHKILSGEYKNDFRFNFGGKRRGGGKVSATSEFFSMFVQASAYDWEKSQYANGGEVGKGTKIVYYKKGNFDKKWFDGGGEIKAGDFIKKKGSNLELKVLEVGNDWRSKKDYIKIYNDVTDYTTTLVDWSDYELVGGSTYKGGGELESKVNHINSTYDGVIASKTYSDNRIQVVSPYFNTLSEIKRKEFNGSGLLERYGNTSSYVLYSNKSFYNGGGVGKGTKIVYYKKGNFDKKWFDGVEKYYLDRGYSEVIAEEYANGGGVEYSSEISKQQLESMVGRSLNGWNDDIVYHNGEKYKKCFLRPYYKKQ